MSTRRRKPRILPAAPPFPEEGRAHPVRWLFGPAAVTVLAGLIIAGTVGLVNVLREHDRDHARIERLERDYTALHGDWHAQPSPAP